MKTSLNGVGMSQEYKAIVCRWSNLGAVPSGALAFIYQRTLPVMAMSTRPLESAVMEKHRSQLHNVDKAAMGKIALQLEATLEKHHQPLASG